MNSRKFQIPDEFEKRNYIELLTDQRKRSVTINIQSNGGYGTVMIDMAKLKKAMEEMNG